MNLKSYKVKMSTAKMMNIIKISFIILMMLSVLINGNSTEVYAFDGGDGGDGSLTTAADTILGYFQNIGTVIISFFTSLLGIFLAITLTKSTAMASAYQTLGVSSKMAQSLINGAMGIMLFLLGAMTPMIVDVIIDIAQGIFSPIDLTDAKFDLGN